MSIFSKLVGAAVNFIPGGSIVKGVASLAIPAAASLFKKPAAKLIAGGVATTAAGMGLAKITSGGTTTMAPVGTLPALPGLAAAQTSAIQQAGAGGLPVPFWKGPGGKLQMPWNDPRIPEYLKQFALDDAYLKQYVRAPKGYVIVRDANGRPFAVNKAIAKSFGIWKPAAKPPISATDWKHFRRNKAIEKKIRKNFGSTCRPKTSGRSTAKKKR